MAIIFSYDITGLLRKKLTVSDMVLVYTISSEVAICILDFIKILYIYLNIFVESVKKFHIDIWVAVNYN